MGKKSKKTVVKKKSSPRRNRVSFMLNDEEVGAINKYVRKYKVENKSKFFRTVIFTHVWESMVRDYPTLFNEKEMRG